MDLTALINIMVTLIVFGFIAFLVLTYIPMPEPVKQVLVVIMLIVLILFLLNVLGIWDGPRLHGTS